MERQSFPDSSSNSSLNSSSNDELDASDRTQITQAIRRAWPVEDRSAEAIAARADAITHGTIGSGTQSPPSRRRADVPPRSPAFVARRVGIAGGIAVTLGLALLLVFQYAPHIDHKSTRTYATSQTQQATIALDDGSHVVLAPGSSLTVEQFTAGARHVVLERGEAYFTVAHVSGAPFTVSSARMLARVLGTTFLVRRAGDGARAHVVVTEGKVLVMPRGRPALARAVVEGQSAEVRDSTANATSADEISPSTEWDHGRVVFHHTPVETVLGSITRWYGYQFRYADSALAKRPITIWFSMESSAAALAKLEQLLQVDLNVRGDTVTLTPRSLRRNRTTPRTPDFNLWTPTREVGR